MRPEGLGPKALGSLDPRPEPAPHLSSGLLEDERLASAQQAEVFTKQIQQLQGNSQHSDRRAGGHPNTFVLRVWLGGDSMHLLREADENASLAP